MPRRANWSFNSSAMRAISAPFFAFSSSSRSTDQLVRLRHQIAERKVLQFAAQALHAHAAGQRRVDVERVLGDARALGLGHEMQRAHVVQAVGELDQQHAHVVGDGEQELAEILGLLRVLGGEIELVELGQAVDEAADLGAEHAVDLVAGDRRVLDRVVQHGGDDGGVVELELGEDRGDFERMREIGVAGGALLLAVRLHREDIGAIEQILVRLRIVAPDALDQFVLPHHSLGIGLMKNGRTVRLFTQYRIADRDTQGSKLKLSAANGRDKPRASGMR